MQGTSHHLQRSPEALWGIQGSKTEQRGKTDFVFKYIKMDTVGLYIHIHLTKPEEEGIFKVSDT